MWKKIYVYILLNVHSVLKTHMIYVTIKHDFPQHGSLLKLLDKLYRQL